MGTGAANSRRRDCSSFFSYTLETVTPTETITITPTIISLFTTDTTVSDPHVTQLSTTLTTEYEDYGAKKRQATASASPSNTLTTISPTAVPTYASACSGTAGYSSACSCLSVVPWTTTVFADRVTVTTTAPPYTYVEHDTVHIPNTVTTTAYVADVEEIPCGSGRQTVDRIPFNVHCEASPGGPADVLYTPSDVHDWDSCLRNCVGIYECLGAEFDLVARSCTLYHDNLSETPLNAATQKVFAFVASRLG